MESGNRRLQQIGTRFLNMVLMVVDGKEVFVPWSPLCSLSAALPWGCVCLSSPCWRGKGVCASACWFPSTLAWSVFCPDDLEQSAGPGSRPQSWIGENGLGDCCLPPMRLLGKVEAPSGSRLNMVTWAPAEFPAVPVAVACSPSPEWCPAGPLA